MTITILPGRTLTGGSFVALINYRWLQNLALLWAAAVLTKVQACRSICKVLALRHVAQRENY